ncbi:nuclear transport factor 2 family protein [Rhodococcus sp. ZPP]|uniref:YybH family protein n=1 Tax=Rhodococcus sp. ZPP TaxID=2749906 RepID=UPI001AD85D9E|nr:nuclear transport factor 2 family protein [Rhodococcus sp. ZPP]QTJ67148.1 nuclear transport factor 2 family protein [Rhodococcus sp. ZPP]
MTTAVPEVVTRYFEADARRDIDALVALFTDDAVVIDEGKTRRGATEIRGWRTGAASEFEYTTEVIGVAAADDEDRYLVTGRLDGNFPGGTAVLTFEFTVTGELISRLEIAP